MQGKEKKSNFAQNFNTNIKKMSKSMSLTSSQKQQ